jgi:predicted CXXCH cytochrome family protein
MTRARISIAAAAFFLAWCTIVAWAQPAAVRLKPDATTGQTAVAGARESERGYVGSAACSGCHAPIYARWSRTRMANVIRDPKVHPDAIIPDLTTGDPLVTFTKDDIAFVYGSKWKQRYFTRVGDDYFPLGAQWDVTHKQWRRYFAPEGTEWWLPHYPADNMKRPTGPTCDGCHSVNYNVRTRQVTEWNVGCEKCHGPGGDHVARPARDNIFNPAKVDPVHATDTCIQCHSQGQPLANPIEGRYYDWPVGFRVGLNLSDFWRLEDGEPGKTTFTHFADGTGHKNRMQGNDFVTSLMYRRGVTCFSCHDVHGTEHNADLIRPASTVCLQCHGPSSANGPHAKTIEQHTHHQAGSPGNECVGCHMPKIEQTLGDVMVRSHTFRFIPPSATEKLKVPNSCTACHIDKSNAWAVETLKTWPELSPWRLEH